MLIKLFRYLFLIKEIKSKSGILHFQRWRIFACPLFSIFIHKIYLKDEDLHSHNHPWNYINVLLSGGYEELYYQYGKPLYRNVLPFQITKRKHDIYHSVNHVFKSPTTTLFLIGKKRYKWGYFVNGEEITNNEYREKKRAGIYNE